MLKVRLAATKCLTLRNRLCCQLLRPSVVASLGGLRRAHYQHGERQLVEPEGPDSTISGVSLRAPVLQAAKALSHFDESDRLVGAQKSSLKSGEPKQLRGLTIFDNVMSGSARGRLGTKKRFRKRQSVSLLQRSPKSGRDRGRRFRLLKHIARRTGWRGRQQERRTIAYPLNSKPRALQTRIILESKERTSRQRWDLPGALRLRGSEEQRLYMSLPSNLPQIDLSLSDWTLEASRHWRTTMAKIEAPYLANVKTPRQYKPVIEPGPFLSFIKDYDKAKGSRERRMLIHETWIKLTEKEKEQNAQSALLLALNDAPNFAFRILKDLEVCKIRIPTYVIQDVLDHITVAKLNSVPLEGRGLHPTTTKTILDMAIFAIEHWAERSANRAILGQRMLWTLMQRLSQDQLLQLLNVLERHDCTLTTETICQLVGCLARNGVIDRALHLLTKIPKEHLSWSPVQWACVILLRSEFPVDNIHALRIQILQRLFQTGLKPGETLRNVIIMNAMEAGDVETALDMFGSTTTHGLSATSATYGALLRGVEHYEADFVAWVVKDAKEHGVLDQVLGNAAIHALFKLEQRKPSKKPFDKFLHFYRQIFDASPLRELSILWSHEGLSFDPESPELPPPPQTLSSMVQAWCQQYEGSQLIKGAYERYMYHMLNGHTLISPMAEYAHVNNAFLMGLRGYPGNLSWCSEVVQNMLHPPPVARYVHIVENQRPTADTPESLSVVPVPFTSPSRVTDLHARRKIAPPSTVTWNILLFAMLRAGEADAAEKVLTLMQSRGFELNDVTWNTLISGLSRTQDAERVVEAVERMEKAGFKADDFTRKALASFVNRKALIEALDRAMKRKEEH